MVLRELIKFCNFNNLAINSNKTAMKRIITRQRHQLNEGKIFQLDILDENWAELFKGDPVREQPQYR